MSAPARQLLQHRVSITSGRAVCSCGSWEHRGPEGAAELHQLGVAHVHAATAAEARGVRRTAPAPPSPAPEPVPEPPAERAEVDASAVLVLSSRGLWRIAADEVVELCPAAAVSGTEVLGRWALAAGVRSVLVHSSAMPAEAPPGPVPDEVGRDGWPGWVDSPSVSWGAPWRCRVQPGGAGPWVSVVFLAWDTELPPYAGGWGQVAEPVTLMRGLWRFSQLLGVGWADSAGRTSERLILATHPVRRGGVRLGRNAQIPEPARDGALEWPTAWRRPLTTAERRGRWVHVYDVNAQHLGVWQSLELPRPVLEDGAPGDPVHLQVAEGLGLAFDKRVPGLHRLPELTAAAEAAGLCGPGQLPLPWDTRREWFTTPTVERAAELLAEHGAELPPIVEAYTWPTHTRYLRGAGERMSKARAELVGSDAPHDEAALRALKSLYKVQVGRLQAGFRAGSGSGWDRPDWSHAIRATARCRLDRKLRRLTAQPFYLLHDEVGFVTAEPDAGVVGAGWGLPIGSGLGQFSIARSVPLTKGLRDQLGAAETAQATAKVLREVAGG